MEKSSFSGFWVVVVGLGVLLVAFLASVFHYHSAVDVATALAAMTGTIGAVVGAYFGVQAGRSGGAAAADIAERARQEASEIAERAWREAEAARAHAEDLATSMAAAADPDKALEVLKLQQLPKAPEEKPHGASAEAVNGEDETSAQIASAPEEPQEAPAEGGNGDDETVDRDI